MSTKEQNEDRQMLAMLEHGVRAANIFMDKQSGKDFDRPSYKRLVERLAPGDTLFVKSIDRLGRSYSDIIEQWRMITNGIKASIVVIDMPLLDTRQKEKDLTGALIADLVLQILSYVAQTEREFNHRRQAEGIAAARLKGRRFGRPPARPPQRFPEMLAAWRNKEISARRAARELGVSNKTFASWAMRAGE
ncbi:MAG: recombinase family protein [Clostridiales bacterium]|nr:recombinase family protein [Clostridiales bacterium]